MILIKALIKYKQQVTVNQDWRYQRKQKQKTVHFDSKFYVSNTSVACIAALMAAPLSSLRAKT